MDIRFDWLVDLCDSSRDAVEHKIKTDIEEFYVLNPCHSGDVIVSVLSSSLLGSTIEGDLKCSCGQTYAAFRGLSVGKKIDYCVYNNRTYNVN